MLLGKAVEAGADTGAGWLVSMGCGMGVAGNTSAIFDVPIVAEAQVQYYTKAPFAGRMS